MSGNFFFKFDSEYFSLIIFLKYLLILLLIVIFVTKMTLLEKNKICRTFRAVGHLGTLQTSTPQKKSWFWIPCQNSLTRELKIGFIGLVF